MNSPSEERVMRAREVLPREDWQWLADQLRAWPVKRVHPDRTMCEAALRPMAADVIEAALAEGSGIGELLSAIDAWIADGTPETEQGILDARAGLSQSS